MDQTQYTLLFCRSWGLGIDDPRAGGDCATELHSRKIAPMLIAADGGSSAIEREFLGNGTLVEALGVDEEPAAEAG